MKRQLAILVVGSLFICPNGDAQESAPTDAKLIAAREAYDSSMETAKKKLLNALQAKEESARKAGNLKTVEQVRSEIKAFEEDPTKLPSSTPLTSASYQKEIKRALDKLVGIYQKAIKDYTKANKLDEAKAIQLKLEELQKESESDAKGAVAIPGPAPNATFDINPVGRPYNFRAGQLPRYAVWVDDQGWHVRMTDKGGARRKFSGIIKISGGHVTALNPLKDDNGKENDVVTYDRNQKTLDFEVLPGGVEDGFDFSVDAETTQIGFNFLLDEKPESIRIFIGKAAINPRTSSFSLRSPKTH